MNAIAIGPMVFAPDRFAAILAIAAFLLTGEILARKLDRRFSPWAWGATIAFIVGARAGHVVQHAGSFSPSPQGGLHRMNTFKPRLSKAETKTDITGRAARTIVGDETVRRGRG